MSKLISVASGFQYSVNIAYDLNNEDKLKNFIPTKSALSLLEDVLLSARPTSTDRARVLIGAYGKGKSHIILMILSLLMKKDQNLFEKTMPKVKENTKLYQLIQNYYASDNKILPVVISGSNTSLPQAFLLALQRTLAENELMYIMPETNYKAAISVIRRWENEFPNTFKQFAEAIDGPIHKFILALEDFNIQTYEKFEKIYPTLTAGSIFNPFLGFDVADLYEGVVKELNSKGYTGIYVVYDEFSKFLEANISEASVSDTKMLQDFAEKCNRSGKNQIHLMLISHKEIANYIDKLPKQKVDGWRGVSERFAHVHLNNNFTQTYEVIASVIQKDDKQWVKFCKKFISGFESLEHRYVKHALFSDMGEEEICKTFRDCYPLHPVSTFILPRLSERVAQNERTLFTFLSAKGITTLPSFLENYDDKSFDVITPDLIYDYFEPLLKKEVYSGDLHKNFILTSIILDKLQADSLESKIVKALSLIYILEQFEKLKPTKDEIVGMFEISYPVEEIEFAINNLIEKEFVVYLKRSNDYLRLKQTSGEDIKGIIKDIIENQKSQVTVKNTLNNSNFDNFVYPSRYNDAREMTRFFSFEFINEEEVTEDIDWKVKSEKIEADGIVYGIILKNNENIENLKKRIIASSIDCDQIIFIIPKKYTEIEAVVREFNAVKTLRDRAEGDKVLFDEYDVIYEDLREVISMYISLFTRPEELKSRYFYCGEEKMITRKAALTGLMSDICEKVFFDTPIINNEAINKAEITTVANNSRSKILAGLLRKELEPGLGLTGTGQEVSIMRSTLIRTGIVEDSVGLVRINLKPKDKRICNMLSIISEFVYEVGKKGETSFVELYNRLMAPKYHIGLRRGLIPIYLAAVFHEYKQEIIILDKHGQVTLNAETIVQINANPTLFSLAYLDWNPEKEEFISKLEENFKEFVIGAEKSVNSYDYVALAMKRWYMSLPRYVKELKCTIDGTKIDKRYISFIASLRKNTGSHELLFELLPDDFGYGNQFNIGVLENIVAAKKFYDEALSKLRNSLIDEVKKLFAISNDANTVKRMSISSIITDWCEALDDSVFDYLFSDGTDKALSLFKVVTNDEGMFICRLAKIATDLRLEDWDDNTYERFSINLGKYKEAAENYHKSNSIDISTESVNEYQVTFIDSQGEAVTKRFDKVETGKRGQLLFNSLTAQISAMGQSISEHEKRQILMDVLKELC